jgi:cytochrome b561
MLLRNNHEKYGAIAKCFHWVMALAILMMLAVGFIMTDLPMSPDKFRVYGIHKSIGALILIAAFLRLFWRFINIVPELPADIPTWQKLGAHGSHVALYILMFVMPLSGWLMSSAAGFQVSVFGWFLLPNLIAPSPGLRKIFGIAHEVLAFAIIGLVSLHILAALKHHFIDKDTILRRMLPLLLLVVALPLQAAEPKAWYVVGDKSTLEFIATQNDSPLKGLILPFKVAIAFSPEAVEQSRVQAEMEVKDIHLPYPQADQAIKSADWFDMAKFPLVKFSSTRITHSAGNNFVAEGDLTIRDITLPVILHFTLEEYSDTRAHVKGEATLNRNAFGVGQGEWKSTDVIKDEVAVKFNLIAQSSPWTAPTLAK